MFKLIFSTIFLYNSLIANSFSNEGFDKWLTEFQSKAISSGISEKVVKDIMSNAKFLPKVIEYDRFQPEFYEDTFTYIKKRSSDRKIREGLKLYKERKLLKLLKNSNRKIVSVNGHRDNFGKYLGKMDISSLTTLNLTSVE